MFGTDDVIYVPEGAQLVFDDIYRWRRFKLDVRHFGLRMEPHALAEAGDRLRQALARVQESPRFVDSAVQIAANTEEMIHTLGIMARPAPDAASPGSLQDFFRAASVRWWLRITDLPGESFFDDDYETTPLSSPGGVPYNTFGTLHVAQLDGMDLQLAKDAAGVQPLCIDVPPETGLTRWTIPPDQPLALLREYCGVHGASAHGHTMNVDTRAAVAEEHQFCTPLGRLGSKLFATLYVHYTNPVEAEVLGRIGEDAVPAAAELLEESGFALIREGRSFRIYGREGDIVHLYAGLDGKESEGAPAMPAFILVSQAAGQTDPMNRGALFEGIRDALRAAKRGRGGSA